MDDSQKTFAPKPVKRNSNPKGIKLITEFEKITSIREYTYTPNSKLNPDCFLKKAVSAYDIFEKDIRDSSSTSELLSILNQSTGIDSFLYQSEISEINDDCNVIDELRISMPPMRCDNPFFKNFKEMAYETSCDTNCAEFNTEYFDDVSNPK
jgi:hypothetical protein